jgi:hypothetical protein
VNNISIHHTWIMKQWVRGPLASQDAFVDFRNNILEDWQLWGLRYESDASGNIVNSIISESQYAKDEWNNAANGLNITTSRPVYVSGVEFRGTAKPDFTATSATELPAAPVATQSVAAMEPVVRSSAGAMPRDAIDQRYINLAPGWRVGKTTPIRF